jgi:hypothetical protein
VVDGKAASLAERLVLDSLIPNMARFYQSLGGEGDSETTKAIASFLLREQKVRVTPTDIIHHVQAVHNRKADQVRDEVSPLIVMGWLTPEGDDERRARAWIVNQAIYTQFAERAAQAKMQAALAREAIASSVRGDGGGAESYERYCARNANIRKPSFSSIKKDPAPNSADMPRAHNNVRNSASLKEKVLQNARAPTNASRAQ